MRSLGDEDLRVLAHLEERPFNSERQERVRRCQVAEIAFPVDWHGTCNK